MKENEGIENAAVPEEQESAVAAPESNTPAEENGERKPRRRKRLLKWLGIFLIGLVVVLAVALICRDVIVKQAVTRVGSMVTGTKVELDAFSSSLFGGSAEITGFRVGNPEGYQNPEAFRVEKVVVCLNPGSIFSSKIEIFEVSVSGMRVDFEMRLDGSSNLTDIQKNVEQFAGTGDAEPAEEQTPAEAQEAESASEKQLVIRLFQVSDSRVSLSSNVLKTTADIPLPPIEMTDVGEGQTMGETFQELYAQLIVSISKAVAATDYLKDLGSSLQKSGEGISQEIKSGIDQFKDIFSRKK